MKNYLLSISLIVNIIVLALFISMAIYYHLPGKIMCKLFGVSDISPIFDKKIVIIGDSLITTHHSKVFKKLMLQNDIATVGTRSGSIKDLNYLLKNIYRMNPEVLVITANGYDIYCGKSPENVFNSYLKIIESLQEHGIKPVVQSALYAVPDKLTMEEYSVDVGKLNLLLNEYCVQNKIKYLDLNTFLSSGYHFIAEYSSRRGVSPNKSGYELWTKELLRILQ